MHDQERRKKTFPSHLHYIFLSGFFIALAVFSGYLGFLVPNAIERATPVWFHTGIYLALYCVWGVRAIPTILIASFTTNFVLADRPVWISVLLPLTHVVGVYIGSNILGPVDAMQRHEYVFSKIGRMILAAIVTPILNSILGAAYIGATGNLSIQETIVVFGTWWIGLSLGILLITPLFLAWWQQRQVSLINSSKLGMLIVCFAPVLYFILFTPKGDNFIFGIFPLILISAWFLPRNLFLTAIFLLNCVAILATIDGAGPFRAGSFGGNLTNLQIFLGTVSITALVMEVFRHTSTRTPVVALLMGWLLSGTIYYIFSHNQEIKDQQQARAIALDLENEMSESIDRYVDTLRMGIAFLNNTDILTRDRWRSFVQQMDLAENYPGILSVGIMLNIPNHYTRRFTKIMHERGYPHFSIFPPGDRDRQLVISFLAPENESNMKIIGSDVLSLENIPQKKFDIGPNDTFFTKSLMGLPDTYTLFVPLLKNENADIPNKLTSLGGFLFCPFDANAFFHSVVDRKPRQMAAEIFDTPQRSSQSLFTSHESALQPRLGFEFITHHKLANHVFTIGWRRSVNFATSRDFSGVILSSAAALLTLLLAGIIGNLEIVREEAERIAREKTNELEKQRMVAFHTAKMASLGEMAGGISHEINNPLAIIHGTSQMLQAFKDQATPQQIHDGLKLIEKTSMRISKIITGLRTFSRSGENDPFAPESVATIVDQTLELCKEKLRANHIKLIVDFIPNIKIDCRATQISQILLNLLNNSNDVVEDLPSERWIRLSFADHQTDIALAVSNSGPKIPEATRDKIFQPFFTTKDGQHGTGLGLSISLSIAESHHGRLFLDETKEFTSFVLVLPKTQAEASPPRRNSLFI